MTKCLSSLLLTALGLAASGVARAQSDAFHAPDALVLKSGTTVRGLIIKNTADAVVLQHEMTEAAYPKSEIVRIIDVPDVGMEFTDALRRGELPAWRVIANDLRSLDEVKSLAEIPATLIDVGPFKNVPYKSFRVNGDIELNIYGDPNDPVAIELGIYGMRSGRKELQRMLRNYLAGYMTSRAEVAALYSLPLDRRGKARAGSMVFEISQPGDPDAYGAWWVSVYNEKELAKVRLDDREYARLTRPMSEIVDQRGRVIQSGWNPDEMEMAERMDSDDRVILRGFYRDKNGDFRLITR